MLCGDSGGAKDGAASAGVSVEFPFRAPLNDDRDGPETVVAPPAALALELEVLEVLVIAKCFWVEYARAQNLVPLGTPGLELIASPCLGRRPTFAFDDFGLGGSAAVDHLCCMGTGDGTPAAEKDCEGLRNGRGLDELCCSAALALSRSQVTFERPFTKTGSFLSPRLATLDCPLDLREDGPGDNGPPSSFTGKDERPPNLNDPADGEL